MPSGMPKFKINIYGQKAYLKIYTCSHYNNNDTMFAVSAHTHMFSGNSLMNKYV